MSSVVKITISESDHQCITPLEVLPGREGKAKERHSPLLHFYSVISPLNVRLMYDSLRGTGS